MSAKRNKRIRQTNEEYEEVVQQVAQQKALATLDDKALFVVDRAGSKTKRRRVQEEIIPKEQGTFVSKTEKHLIEKQLKRIQSGQPRKVYGSNVVALPGNKKIATEVKDIWGEGEEESVDKVEVRNTKSAAHKARPHKQSLKIALPGQSYNPSHDDHQDTLAQAVSIHLKKIEDAKTAFDLIADKEAEEKVKKEQLLVIAGDSSDDEDEDDEQENGKAVTAKFAVNSEKLKNMTAVLLDEDQEENSDDSDDDSELNNNNNSSSDKKLTRQPKMLTKAQRNKRRIRRQAEHDAKLAAVEKKKNLDLIVVKHIKKSLTQEQAELAAQRKIKETLEKERLLVEEEAKTKRLRVYEASAIPLSDELTGSLRTMKPKGAPSMDTMHAMIASGETRAAFARKRRAYEKPHGAKRVKWFAKYKV